MPTPIITAEESFKVGQELVIESLDQSDRWGVIFEDDGIQGMFHMLDDANPESPLLETLVIYYVDGVDKKEQDVEMQIAWSEDRNSAVLVINGYPHAVVDFANGDACCRLGRASSYNKWNESYQWDDALLKPFVG